MQNRRDLARVRRLEQRAGLCRRPSDELDTTSLRLAMRGPIPLTANVPGINNAVGATPGLGVIRVTESGRSGVLQAVAPISHVVGGVEQADPHGIAVRRTH